MSSTTRSFGACVVRGCKTRHVAESPISFQIESGWINLQNGYCGWFKPGDIYTQYVATKGFSCPTHGHTIKWESLKGTYKADKICDGRCVSAKRSSCECSCGGENHGKGNSIA